ncbi:MAG: LytTR family transcriptional regulator [Treponema sp.]|nr:LytTR family transcriptional regulator [Treponema sp.]
MIIKLEKLLGQKDIEVHIKYPEGNKDIEHIVSFLNSFTAKIECFSGSNQTIIPVSEIYFVESMQNKTIIHSENENYHSKLRLYRLKEKLANYDFIQISKYCIINANKLEKVKSLFNSRMEATLSNGKRLIVTRKYLECIKQVFLKDEQ